MNEASGQRNDSHGVNHLNDTNSAGSAIGKQGNAVRFVAATPAPYLSISDNPNLSTGNIDFTLSAMVYLESVSQTMILVNKGDKANINARDLTLYFDQPTSKLAFRVGNGITSAVVLSSSTVTTGQWYFVTAWHNAAGDTLNIQVSNGAVSATSYTGGAMDTSLPLTIGAFADGTTNLLGIEDEVSFYKRVLTASERTWLYNNGLGRTYADVNPPAQSGWKTRAFTYNASIPHAVASVTENSTPVASYTYDANGNMTCRVEEGVTYLHAYNTENRISSITRLASGDCATPGANTTQWDFAYDGDGVRVATLTTPYENGNPISTQTELVVYYFGGAYEVSGAGELNVEENQFIFTSTSTAFKKYYSFAGQMVAMNDGTGLQYFLTDHLGSVVAVTDASGTLIAQQRYLPFGGERTNVPSPNAPSTDYGYTGQRDLDPGMGGLMDYKARFYSPYLNHFTQPDTIIPDPSNPQAWNRFAYVHNNPLKYTDPSGNSFFHLALLVAINWCICSCRCCRLRCKR